MSPRRILDQRVSNFPSESWFRELRAMEADSEFISPRVVVLSDLGVAAAQDLESAAQAVRALPGQGAQEAVAAGNDDREQGQVGAGASQALLTKQI
jgi:hypothetical protein